MRHDDEAGIVIGKGTRPLAAGSQPIERPRDPAEVLRMWPASVSPAPARAPTKGSHGVNDKVELAHLALELYRELGQVDQIGAMECASHELEACTNQACEARINALRGGLVEACLLVQRVVMMSSATSGVEADVREILALLDR